MGMFKQQEMSKSPTQVKEELKGWYNWFVNHIPSLTSRAFTTFKDKVMGLYKWVKSEKEPKEEQNKEKQNKESFNPVEFEQVFDRAYRSYRINGTSRMDIDTFFDQIRHNLIDHVCRELTD